MPTAQSESFTSRSKLPERTQGFRTRFSQLFDGLHECNRRESDPTPNEGTLGEKPSSWQHVFELLKQISSESIFYYRLKNVDSNATQDKELFDALTRGFEQQIVHNAEHQDDSEINAAIIQAATDEDGNTYIPNIEKIANKYRHTYADISVYTTLTRVYFAVDTRDVAQKLAYIQLTLNRLLRSREEIYDYHTQPTTHLDVVLLHKKAQMLYGLGFLSHGIKFQRPAVFIHHSSLEGLAHELVHGVHQMLNGEVSDVNDFEEGLAVNEGEFDGVPLHVAKMNPRTKDVLLGKLKIYGRALKRTGFPIGFTSGSLIVGADWEREYLPYVHGKILVDFLTETFGYTKVIQIHQATTHYEYDVRRDLDSMPQARILIDVLQNFPEARTTPNGTLLTVTQILDKFNEYVREHYS